MFWIIPIRFLNSAIAQAPISFSFYSLKDLGCKAEKEKHFAIAEIESLSTILSNPVNYYLYEVRLSRLHRRRHRQGPGTRPRPRLRMLPDILPLPARRKTPGSPGFPRRFFQELLRIIRPPGLFHPYPVLHQPCIRNPSAPGILDPNNKRGARKRNSPRSKICNDTSRKL